MKNQSVAAEPMFSIQPSYPQIDPAKVYNSIVDVVFAIDDQGIFRFVSPSCFDLFGYTQQEMTDVPFLNFIHPDDIEKTVQIVKERTHDCRTSNFENRYYKKDGSIVPIIWSGRWDAVDQLLYCVARDGSEKSAIEQRLRKAQQIARVANFEFDLVSNSYTYTSETLFDIFGIDPVKHPTFTPEIFWSLVHPEDAPFVREDTLRSEHMCSSTIEYRIVRPDGVIVYINRIREILRDTNGKPVKTIGTIQDITDRKIGEEALKQSELKFRSLVQNGNDLLGIIDPYGTYLFVGENVKDQLGFSVAELIGKNALNFIHPDDAVWVGAQLKAVSESHQLTVGPFRFRNSKGEWQWVETTISNHLDNPAIAGFVVNSRNVTEKLQKEEELKQYVDELRKLSLIAKETTNPVILQDSDRNVLWVNNAFIQLTGYSLDECKGKYIGEICDGPETDNELIQYVQKKFSGKEPFRIETLNYKKSGETYWSDVSCQPVLNEQGEVVQYFSISTDITERKRLEKQLEQEQRKRHSQIAAATLKAQEHERSVVSQELHDNVNQVLTTVKLYTEMCRDGIGNPKEVMEKSIKLLQDSINEIRSLSKRLSAPSLGRIKLAESIKELVNAVAATNRFSVHMDTINIDQLEVGQEVHLAVYRILQEHLTNVLKHAAASHIELKLDCIMGFVHLQVKDNGKGFDPKQKSNGIGITNMITRAESLQGIFTIDSAPGKGCELSVSIPLQNEFIQK